MLVAGDTAASAAPSQNGCSPTAGRCWPPTAATTALPSSSVAARRSARGSALRTSRSADECVHAVAAAIQRFACARSSGVQRGDQPRQSRCRHRGRRLERRAGHEPVGRVPDDPGGAARSLSEQQRSHRHHLLGGRDDGQRRSSRVRGVEGRAARARPAPSLARSPPRASPSTSWFPVRPPRRG